MPSGMITMFSIAHPWAVTLLAVQCTKSRIRTLLWHVTVRLCLCVCLCIRVITDHNSYRIEVFGSTLLRLLIVMYVEKLAYAKSWANQTGFRSIAVLI